MTGWFLRISSASCATTLRSSSLAGGSNMQRSSRRMFRGFITRTRYESNECWRTKLNQALKKKCWRVLIPMADAFSCWSMRMHCQRVKWCVSIAYVVRCLVLMQPKKPGIGGTGWAKTRCTFLFRLHQARVTQMTLAFLPLLYDAYRLLILGGGSVLLQSSFEI